MQDLPNDLGLLRRDEAMKVNYMYRCKPAAWATVIDYYKSDSGVSAVVDAHRQTVRDSRIAGRMPPHWAAKMHRDSNGKVDARVLRPDLFVGIV